MRAWSDVSQSCSSQTDESSGSRSPTRSTANVARSMSSHGIERLQRSSWSRSRPSWSRWKRCCASTTPRRVSRRGSRRRNSVGPPRRSLGWWFCRALQRRGGGSCGRRASSATRIPIAAVTFEVGFQHRQCGLSRASCSWMPGDRQAASPASGSGALERRPGPEGGRCQTSHTCRPT